MEATTRIILTKDQPSGPLTPQRSDVTRIKMDTLKGTETIIGADPESAQRFVREVKYVTYYAEHLASILGSKPLSMGVVEDNEGQTAFRSSLTGWYGAVSANRRSLWQVNETLLNG
jgi:hypothetical protein